jgi:hypothetical protein
MNLEQIREEAWGIARVDTDVDRDRLWTIAEMNRYINRVYRRICKETLCIRDSTTVAVCRIDSVPVDYTTLTPGTQDYLWANDPDSWLYHLDVAPYLLDLHPSIIQIDEMKWAKRAWKLRKVSVSKWQENALWEESVGLPTEYATDLQADKIALNYRDTASDTLRMVVRRLPLVDLVDDLDVPEIRNIYHDRFLHGVLSQMYAKQDVEAFDMNKAETHEAQFLVDIDFIKQEQRELEKKLNPNRASSAFM